MVQDTFKKNNIKGQVEKREEGKESSVIVIKS
jgi:hypothetical protein